MTNHAPAIRSRHTSRLMPGSTRWSRGGRTGLLIAIAGTAFITAACSSGSPNATNAAATVPLPPVTSPAVVAPVPPVAPPAATPLLMTTHTKLGRILVDENGKAIYVLTADRSGHIACNGKCLQFWPVVAVPAQLPGHLPGVTAKLGVLIRTDGVRQLTLGGAPVYTFVGDTRPGSAAGEGKQLSGGFWWVLTPMGSPITVVAHRAFATPPPAAMSTPSAMPSSGGIPQNGGGDGDLDNNGGSSDGDGNI